jgi:hypothetical protein
MGAEVAELGRYFQYRDAAVIVVSATLLGASGTYLVIGAWSSADSGTPTRDRTPADRARTPLRTAGDNDLASSAFRKYAARSSIRHAAASRSYSRWSV